MKSSLTVMLSIAMIASMGLLNTAVAYPEDCTDKPFGAHTHDGVLGLPTGGASACVDLGGVNSEYPLSENPFTDGEIVTLNGLKVYVHDGHYHVVIEQ